MFLDPLVCIFTCMYWQYCNTWRNITIQNVCIGLISVVFMIQFWHEDTSILRKPVAFNFSFEIYNFCSCIWSIIDVTSPLRLNATDFLERLRGQRLVFVGDSLNRNMWESLVCTLRHSIRKKKKHVYEISGRTEFKKKGVYSFRFEASFL